MTKKKLVKDDGNNLQLKTRQPGKVNKNYFGDFKSRFEENLHPLDEMFPQGDLVKHKNVINAANQTQSVDTTTSDSVGHSNYENLSVQTDDSGHSTQESLGALAPRTHFQAPRNEDVLGARAPRKKESGHSKNSNWRKYEKSRSTVRVNLHIDKEIDKKVRQYCLIDSIPKIELKEFYERAVVQLLEILDTQRGKSLGALAPYDDRRLMITSKSNVSLINLYLIYNSIFNLKSKWTVRDDEAGARFNDVDIRIIELGIIQTHFNRGFRPGKINSFQYYINQIEEMMALEFTEETLEAMIEINRARWQSASGKQLDLSFLNETGKQN